ncbi:MAG TPA: DUF4340 domain-containing protein [Spirochaetia bacterium]|nr:DUF4340 domain-containing protein [Spirochaetia bacterium]
MKRRLLTLGIVLVVLAGLVGAYLVVTRPRPVKAASTAPALISADKDKLMKIVLSDRAEGTLTLEKKGKSWSVDSSRQFALDQSNLDDIVLTFTSLTAERVIDEKPADLAQYGLAPPRAVGEAFFSDGTTKTLLLGDKTPTGNAYYLQVKGDAKVYTVWTNHGEQMHWRLADLRDKRISPEIAYDKITYFRLSRADGPVIELKQKTEEQNKTFQLGFSRYLMTRPYSYPRGVDSEKQDQLIKGPQQIQISSFVNDAPKNLAPYGLATPRAEVIVRDASNTLDFLIGSEAGPDKTYFSIRGRPAVYTTTTSSLSFLKTTPWDIVDKFVFIPNIDDVDRIDISSEGASHSLAIARVTKKAEKAGEKATVEATYSVDGKTVEEDSFKAFYQQLVGMQVEGEAARKVPETPDVTVRFFLNKGLSRTATITYARYDRDFDAVFLNGKNDFAIGRQQLTKMLEKLEALAKGEKVTS